MRTLLLSMSLLAVWLLPPLLVEAAVIGPELAEVVATGMCPPAPTDIPAAPCTPGEYLQRVLFGVWSLPFHVLVWGGWTVLLGTCAVAGAAGWAVTRRAQR